METEYLPSARFVKVVGSIVVFCVLVVFLYKGVPALSGAISGLFTDRSALVQQESLDAYQSYRTLDTDGDGLLDWEEALYGTSPELADTNGDGTSDYTEYQQAGGTTSTERTVLSSDNAAVNSSNTDQSNLTESLAKDLYTSLSIAKQQAGGVVTEGDNDRLASIAAESLQTFTASTYTMAELTVLPTSTTADMAKFTQSVESAWKQADLKSLDVQLIIDSIENDSAVPAVVMNKLPDFKKLSGLLVQIPVPNKVAQQYLQYVNTTEQYMTAVVAIASSDVDPARAISAVTNFETILDAFVSASDKLQQSIKI